MIVPKFHFIQHLIALSGDPLLGLTIVLVVFGIVGLIHFVFKKIPKLSPKQRKKFERIYFSFLGFIFIVMGISMETEKTSINIVSKLEICLGVIYIMYSIFSKFDPNKNQY